MFIIFHTIFFAWRKKTYFNEKHISLESTCLTYFNKEPILVFLVVFDADLGFLLHADEFLLYRL